MLDKKILKAATWVGIGNVVAQGLAFLIFVILTWFFTKEEYGYIRWVIQMGLFMATIAVLGFPPALARYIGSIDGNKRISEIYISNAFFSILISTLIVSVLSLFIFNFNYLIVLVIVGNVVSLFYMGIIRGFIDYKKIGIFNLLRNTIKLTFIFMIYLMSLLKTPLYVITVYAFGGWIVILFLELIHPVGVKIRLSSISKQILKKLSRFSLFTFIATISYSFILTISYTILKWNYSYDVVATFSIAVTLSILYTFVPGAVNTILMPKIAGSKTKEKNIKYLKQAIILTLVFSFLIFVGIFLAGKWAIVLLFGSSYLDSYTYLLILSFGAIFAGLRNNFVALWEGINKPEISAIDITTAAIVTFVFGMALISLFGPYGVAIGYSFGFLSAVVIDVLFFLKYYL